MFSGNWFKRYKIELAIFFAVLVLIAWSVLVWHLAQRELHYRQSAEQQARQYGPSSEDQTSSSCASIAGLGDAIDCVVQKIAAARKTQRDEQDLAAQQGMSEWALWMVLLTGAQAVLSFFGIVLLVRNLGLAREANGNTINAIEQERKSTERELRAYLSVIPAGITKCVGDPAYDASVLIKNVGQAIATGVTAKIWARVRVFASLLRRKC